MTHEELQWEFRAWWQGQHPNGRIYVNRTGRARAGGYGPLLAYGIPAPAQGKDEDGNRRGGGGPDLFAYPGATGLPITIMYEVKTLAHPHLDPNQVEACALFESMGVEVWIVIETQELHDGNPWEVVRLGDYLQL